MTRRRSFFISCFFAFALSGCEEPKQPTYPAEDRLTYKRDLTLEYDRVRGDWDGAVKGRRCYYSNPEATAHQDHRFQYEDNDDIVRVLIGVDGGIQPQSERYIVFIQEDNSGATINRVPLKLENTSPTARKFDFSFELTVGNGINKNTPLGGTYHIERTDLLLTITLQFDLTKIMTVYLPCAEYQ